MGHWDPVPLGNEPRLTIYKHAAPHMCYDAEIGRSIHVGETVWGVYRWTASKTHNANARYHVPLGSGYVIITYLEFQTLSFLLTIYNFYRIIMTTKGRLLSSTALICMHFVL